MVKLIFIELNFGEEIFLITSLTFAGTIHRHNVLFPRLLYISIHDKQDFTKISYVIITYIENAILQQIFPISQ